MNHTQQTHTDQNNQEENWIRDEDLEARRFKNFGQLFWQKIREELRMEILQENKPNQKIKLFEINPEDINIDLQEVKQWSSQNEIIYQQLLENGFADFICNKQNLKEIYEELIFDDQNITQMDQELKKLVNLKVLRLTKNFIERVENIPSKLRELYLHQNKINIISPKIESNNLLYLGLGYNKISDEVISTFGYQLPNLQCLDLCYNELCQIDVVIESLQVLQQLKMLTTYGNPISLLPNYQKAMKHAFQNLIFFDEVKIGNLNSEKQSVGFYLDDELNKKPQMEDKNEIDLDAKIDFDKFNKEMGQLITQFSLNLKILTLDNPQGTIIDKENFPEQESKENPQKFATHFWVQLQISPQKILETAKISLESQFKDEQTEKTRIDFKFQESEILQIDSCSRDQIRKGFMLKLFKSEPVMKFNAETEEKEPVLDENNLPQFEDNILVGICRIETKNWLKDTTDRKIQFKFKLFSGEIERLPEFYIPLQNEQQIIKKNQEKINGMIQTREDQMKPPEPEELNNDSKSKKKDAKKTAKKKEAKKEPKKDAKKKGGKNQEEEEDLSIKFLDWPVYDREYIADSENNLYLNIYEPYLLAVEAEIV